ncbi:intracellular septation protein A [Luminiphilus syltensis NOR5-1B]|uniref:Inner membrane-spanning protein YciB n=1 Tax=Luminiphilus syltensis NOR5-1B TaxID=565045 RepID=B8KQK2_9GAMM|nr:inner membrane-spanning protein YciB [Luminiphilus syltensis]EED35314.1 intracellular septation protein A [Luminiphilus syltensis NOR5-1B]
MKQLLEMLPIVLFFIAYQMDGEQLLFGDWTYTFNGIYSATAVLMLSTVAMLPIIYAINRKLEKRLIWTSIAVLAFGGATLLFKNELFIQWKPTVFNWAMALVFAGSHFFGEKNLIERLMGSQLQLPDAIWRRINWLWVTHFTVVGTLNIVVAYTFSEATWVSYKLYSSIGFTLLLMILTAALMGPHLKQNVAPENGE